MREMFKNQPRFKIYLLGLDLFILLLSFFLALLIMPGPLQNLIGKDPDTVLNCFSSYLIFSLVIVVVFFFSNLYKRNIVITRYRQFILIFISLAVGLLLCALVLVFYNPAYLKGTGKQIFLVFFFISLGLVTLVRVVFMKLFLRFLRRKNISPTKVLIVGAAEPGRHVARALARDKYFNYQVAGFLDDYKQTGKPVMEGYTNLGQLGDLDRLTSALAIDEVIIAVHNAPYNRLIRIVEACLNTGCVVRIYSDLLGIITRKINVETYAGIPLVMLARSTTQTATYPFKRTLDVLASLTALLVLAPLFILIAAGVKLSSSGPVIFKQTRIGKQGEPFDFYKFRSMHVGTASTRHQEFVQNFIRAGSENQHSTTGEIRVFKITDDPRIFPFGKLIRKTSLDEFPQFFNVLKGDMSLVGPRPCLPYEWEVYEPWHRNRLNCVAGCTGIWQALGRSTVSFEEMVILDLYYESNMSIFLDIRIILNTFPVIFLGKGAF